MTGLLLAPNDVLQQHYADTVRKSPTPLLTIIPTPRFLEIGRAPATRAGPFQTSWSRSRSGRVVRARPGERGRTSSSGSPDVPRHVVGDPGRIRQAYHSSHCVKFTASGHVLVSVECEEFPLRMPSSTRHQRHRYRIRRSRRGVFTGSLRSTRRPRAATGARAWGSHHRELVPLRAGPLALTSRPDEARRLDRGAAPHRGGRTTRPARGAGAGGYPRARRG